MEFGSDGEALKHPTSGEAPLTCAIQRLLLEYLRCRPAHAEVAMSTLSELLMREGAAVNRNDQLPIRFQNAIDSALVSLFKINQRSFHVAWPANSLCE